MSCVILFVQIGHSKCESMKFRLPFLNKDPLVSVIRLSGAIGTMGRTSLSDERMAPVIEKAFSKGKPRAVALVINSPGGSPVQSALIAARIRRLAEEKEMPVHAFVEDVAASGGYWLSCAADDIWVDENSIVGSIGVISAGFGAHDFLARQGLERRVYTAGKSKSTLDPFKPEKKEDVERLKTLLDDMHSSFIGYVKSRRGQKITTEVDVFTGEFWLGSKGVELGLVDGVGHIVPKLKELYGDKVQFVNYGRRRGLFRRFGIELAEEALALVEERSAFARFGL